MYIWGNTEGRSRNHRWSGKAIGIKYKFVCLYSCIIHLECKVHAPHYIVICGLSDSTIFFHITSKPKRFLDNIYWTQNVCVLFSLQLSVWNTGLFEMIVGVLTTCHIQYTWDTSICISLFNRTTLQVSVTHLTGALYVHPLWFYKHQHDNRVRSKLSVACQRWWFQWRLWFVPSVPGYLREEEEHKPDPWRNPIERNKKIHILLSQVYCVRQVVKTPTIISNNPVFLILRRIRRDIITNVLRCSCKVRVNLVRF